MDDIYVILKANALFKGIRAEYITQLLSCIQIQIQSFKKGALIASEGDVCSHIGFVLSGQMQVWMIVFLGSFIAALVFGRFYCGWICPINTGIEWIDKLYKNVGIKCKPVPSWAKKPFVKYLMLLLFIIAFITVIATGRRLPVLPVLFFAGILISLFFVPSLWHRYLCPYGTLLNLTGFLARKSYKVDTDSPDLSILLTVSNLNSALYCLLTFTIPFIFSITRVYRVYQTGYRTRQSDSSAHMLKP